jgi:predicted nucleotidyltransferase
MFNSKKQEEEYYASKAKKITAALQKSKIKFKAVSSAGSRAKGKHKLGSDQDMIFSIEGDPASPQAYTAAKKVLKQKFPKAKVYDGQDKNVIHISFRKDDEFDLKHLPHNKYEKQHKKDKNIRKNK